MSLERTALRIAAVMALSNGYQAPFPTMAGPMVFDSRIDALQIVAGDELVPIILVCTDDTTGINLSENNGGPPFEHEATLSLDLSLGMKGEDPDDGSLAQMMQLRTEAELEVRLDFFEAQVVRLLTARGGVWGAEFDKVARRITTFKSIRYIEADGNARIAARQIQMTVALQQDTSLEQLTVFDVTPDAIPAPLGPLLAAIAASTSPYAPAAQTLIDSLLAGGAGTHITLPRLDRVRIFENERDSQDRLTTNRPGGVAEAVFPV